MSDAVSEAAARLERAVGRLAEVAARPRAPEGVPPARLAELAGRLDGTLVRLRAALAELDEADEAQAPDEAPDETLDIAEDEPADAEAVEPAAVPATVPHPTPQNDQER